MNRREFGGGLGAIVIGRLLPVAPVGLLDERIPMAGVADDASPGGRLPTEVAGVRLVDSGPAKKATALARDVSPPYLFNHCMRTYLFGTLIGRREARRCDEELLFLACILHDLGLTERFMGDMPFEIQGAEAAARFLKDQGVSSEMVAVVWDGIAMHPHAMAGHKQPEIALVAAGAGADVLGPDPSQVTDSLKNQVVQAFPRLGFKKAFVKGCADVVLRHPRGATRSFMRDIGERHVPGFQPPNICDAIERAPFTE
jgi:hypothetical protein